MDRAKFYEAIKNKVNLTTQNVIGMDKVLDHGIKLNMQINKLAYTIATAWWESGQTMHPVKEAYWLSENWRRNNLRYFPWYGRGLVQTTWERNYRKIGEAIGVRDLFLKSPDKLLEWEYALPALFTGVMEGLYTGKSLKDYIDDIDESDREDFQEYKNARRVVNGTDRASTIGHLALTFESGLHAAGYNNEFISDLIDDDSLQIGSKGDKVKELQVKLYLKEFYNGKIDGDFGPKTEEAVTQFQKTFLRYGIVDDLTWSKLKEGELR